MKYPALLLLFLAGSLYSFGCCPPDAGVTLHGKIFNAKTNKPVVNASIDIYRNSDFISAYSKKESAGEFTAPLKDFGMYFISISAPGYVETTDTLWLLSEKRPKINRNFYVVPIEVGLTVTLNNIYFDFGKDHLSTQSFPELDKMIRFFQENPGTKFEIAGHTDHSGPADYNLVLSKARAQSVVSYLVSHGVAASQLIAQGYGESKPVTSELTREAEARNRRVEFTVLNVSASTAQR